MWTRVVAAVGVVGALVVGSAGAAGASGWGGRDNPGWGATASGVSGSGRCAAITARTFSGTLVGDDGLGLNATIGFNITDSAGHNLDLATGCQVGGYGAIVQLNHYVGYQGQRLGTTQYDGQGHPQGTVSAAWALRYLPANAAVVWIETYTRTYTGSPCGLRCAGTADARKYGWVNRRGVPVTSGPVRLVAPRTPAFGGRTATLQARLVDRAGHVMDPAGCWAPTVTTHCMRAHVWSINTPEGSRIQGWGAGTRVGRGTWSFPSLAAGQRYKIWLGFVDTAGRSSRTVEVIATATAGRTTYLTIKL